MENVVNSLQDGRIKLWFGDFEVIGGCFSVPYHTAGSVSLPRILTDTETSFRFWSRHPLYLVTLTPCRSHLLTSCGMGNKLGLDPVVPWVFLIRFAHDGVEVLIAIRNCGYGLQPCLGKDWVLVMKYWVNPVPYLKSPDHACVRPLKD